MGRLTYPVARVLWDPVLKSKRAQENWGRRAGGGGWYLRTIANHTRSTSKIQQNKQINQWFGLRRKKQEQPTRGRIHKYYPGMQHPCQGSQNTTKAESSMGLQWHMKTFYYYMSSKKSERKIGQVIADTEKTKVLSINAVWSKAGHDWGHVQHKQFCNRIKDLYEAKTHSDKMTFSPLFLRFNPFSFHSNWEIPLISFP